jgi:hypothetical protein
MGYASGDAIAVQSTNFNWLFVNYQDPSKVGTLYTAGNRDHER